MKKETLADKIARKTFYSPDFQRQWAVHMGAFGPILGPAFQEDYQSRIHLMAALNHISRRDIPGSLKKLEALRDNAEKDSERLFCEFQGFLVMLPARMKAEDPHVFLVSPSGGRYDCSIAMEKKTALGCVMGVEYLLEHLGERAEKLGARREELERQLSLAQADLRRENPYTEQVEAIAARLEEIDRRLEDKPA